MKPTVNPALVRNALTLLGGLLTTLAAADTLSWQVALAALGGALAGWMRTAPGHIDVAELPAGIRDVLRPPAK